MNKNLITTVLDAGGRYGIHPTWKSFTGELDYHLFEPDPVESARLIKKYEHRSLEVKVVDQALAENDGRLTIHFFRNRAMSSSAVRLPVSSLFKEAQREAEVEAERRQKILTPFQDRIDEYVLKFGDEMIRNPKWRGYLSLQDVAKRFIEGYLVEHGKLPTGVHSVTHHDNSDANHDCSDL